MRTYFWGTKYHGWHLLLCLGVPEGENRGEKKKIFSDRKERQKFYTNKFIIEIRLESNLVQGLYFGVLIYFGTTNFALTYFFYAYSYSCKGFYLYKDNRGKGRGNEIGLTIPPPSSTLYWDTPGPGVKYKDSFIGFWRFNEILVWRVQVQILVWRLQVRIHNRNFFLELKKSSFSLVVRPLTPPPTPTFCDFP